MKERLIEFLAYLKIGQDKFEKKVGLSRGFVNKVGDSIRKNNLEKISFIFPELNIAWLQTGVGDMLNNCEDLDKNSYIGDSYPNIATKPNNGENPTNNEGMSIDDYRNLMSVIKSQSNQIDRLISEVEKSGSRADRMLDLIEDGRRDSVSRKKGA